MKTALFLSAFIFSIFTAANATEAVGFFSRGELKDGVSVRSLDAKIHKLFLQRERFFSTQELQDVLSKTSDFVKARYPKSEKLQIGDLSHEHGGPSVGHASHQNGLDVDVVYLTKKKKLQKQDAPFWQEDFVKGKNVTDNFDTARNLELFKYLAWNHPVRRIFVDTAIKTNLCIFARDNNLLDKKEYKQTLKRLRVASLHTNHFHIRITCPKDDIACEEQVEVPNETGCEALITAFEMDETTPAEVEVPL